MREFFGIGGYMREPEGYLSPAHLIFVSSLMLVMLAAAIILGLVYRKKSEKEKLKVIAVAAILMDSIELFKIVFVCWREHNFSHILIVLPLFLCSIPLFTLPLAAFGKGRLREASLDFTFIFGLLIAFLGTYGAGQNYSVYPVLGFDNVVSGITHAISGFAALYIAVSGLLSMKKENIGISFGILCGFCVAAYVADILIPYNYMFLMRGDGTPYDIFYNLVNGNKILYPLIVVFLFLLYISCFYAVFFLIRKNRQKKKNAA
ncbi:MAG: YwaF family protein [Clostridia bacterium]|nr:YwaF family protein [Clostridia bacterium]MBP5765807.1 YwaF family protein [Clostridia bacterium]